MGARGRRFEIRPPRRDPSRKGECHASQPSPDPTIDDLPNLKNVIGGGADPATVASRNVILQGSASVVDEDVITSLLLVWIGDASMVDDKLTWPVRIFRSSNDTEYSRPDLASTEMMHLIIVSTVSG